MSVTFHGIDYDVDKYLADGGQLGDITTMPTAIELAALQRQAPSFERSMRIRRVGIFLKLVSEAIGGGEKVGDKPTEDQLRELWAYSAIIAHDELSTDAERYQLAQAQKLLDLFEESHGRPAANVEESEKWIGSPEGRAA